MNKKLIIFGVIILGVISLVLAQGIGEGDIITQQQLDSINATTINLQCQLEDIGQSHVIQHQGQWFYYRNVSCLSIKPLDIDNPSDGYIITRPHHFPNFLVSDYFACREDNNVQFCNQFYTQVLIDHHQSKKLAIRNRIEQFQTVEGNEEDTDFGDDFGL